MSNQSSSSSSPVKQDPSSPVSPIDQRDELIMMMRDRIDQLERTMARLSIAPLADPPPPPPRLDAGSPAVDSSLKVESDGSSFRSSDPPRHFSVVGPRHVTPHPTASSFVDHDGDGNGYRSVDPSNGRDDRKYYDDRASVPSRRSAGFGNPSTDRPPSVKLTATFDGKSRNDASRLEGFITAVERYLRLYGYDHDSAKAFNVASLALTHNASSWLSHIEHRDPLAIASWTQLKMAMRKHFAPVALEQLAFSELTKVTYDKSVSELNHNFMEQLQLLPKFNNPQYDDIMVKMYLEALERGSGSRFILTNLRMELSRDPQLPLQSAMQIALLAEANIGRKKGRDRDVASSSVPSSGSGSTSWRKDNRFGNGNRFARSSPVKQPSFATPQAKLHHAAADSLDDDRDSEPDAAAELDREMGSESDEESNRAPMFHSEHDDTDHGGDPFADVPGDIALNMIRFAKKFGDLFNLSADELDRRRRNNLCFNCGGAGHRSRDCKKPRPSPQGANGSGGSSKKSQQNGKNKHF